MVRICVESKTRFHRLNGENKKIRSHAVLYPIPSQDILLNKSDWYYSASWHFSFIRSHRDILRDNKTAWFPKKTGSAKLVYDGWWSHSWTKLSRIGFPDTTSLSWITWTRPKPESDRHRPYPGVTVLRLPFKGPRRRAVTDREREGRSIASEFSESCQGSSVSSRHKNSHPLLWAVS